MSGEARLYRRDGETVTCIACGESVDRDDAREYDKHGDRFDRAGKSFEYLCKPCYRECSHQPRDGLEATLVAAGAGEVSRDAFLRQYLDTSDGGTETPDC